MGREGNLTGAAVSTFKEQHILFNIIYIMRSTICVEITLLRIFWTTTESAKE